MNKFVFPTESEDLLEIFPLISGEKTSWQLIFPESNYPYTEDTINMAAVIPYEPEMIPYAQQYADGLYKIVVREWKPLQIFEHMYEDLNDEQKLKICLQLPHLSISGDGRVAYWPDASKCAAGREVVTTVGRYLSRQLGIREELDVWVKLHNQLNGLDADYVKFIENNDLNGWRDVYRSHHIRSCMNNREYGVTQNDTYRCYATAAFGLPDNGLRLAYISHPKGDGSPDTAVARCIVHQPTMTYVRVYGDDNLESALKSMGYTYSSGYPEDLILWAGEHKYTPYVDGDNHWASHHWSSDANCYYWELDCGDYDLQNTSGILGGEICPNCVESWETVDRPMYENGDIIYVCDCCYDNLRHAYYHGDLVAANNYDILTVGGEDYIDDGDNLAYYDIVYSEYHQEYMFLNDAVFSDYMDSYIHINDVVYVDYMDDYYLSGDAIRLGDLYVLCMDLDTHPDLDYLPKEGLSPELDDIRREMLAEYKGDAA